MTFEWENPSLQDINRLPARSSFYYYDTPEKALEKDRRKSAFFLSLDGEWDFTLEPTPLSVPEEYKEESYILSEKWNKIKVPGCFQMQGYGTPVYSASPYLFPTDPPYVAADNDTGCYRTEFSLKPEMEGKDIILTFEGVASMFYVYVNGSFVGMSKGAHMTAEFDITAFLHPGKNLLYVKVLRFSDGSYLEIQDMYHMSGIFRTVSLSAVNKSHVSDLYVKADMNGNLKIHADISDESKVKAFLYDHENLIYESSDIDVKNGSFDHCFKVSDVKLWSAEDPNLYTLILKCDDTFVSMRVGFRSIWYEEGKLLVNGKAIKARGVNHHDTNTDLGWAVGYENLLKDVLLMKRHNINFVRTSHYPSDEVFYDLCDLYGLYVLDEADIECHGMGITDINQISKDPTWEYAYVNRAERMVKRDRNHPSVIAWSMGNESGFGDNHRSVSKRMKELDDRLIHYEAARDLPPFIPEEAQKDPQKMFQMIDARNKTPWDSCVDFESVMYPRHAQLDEYGQRTDPRPFLICEYAHSMGNSPGSLKEYWDKIYEYPKLLGACVWEWQDHGIRKYTEDGKMYFASGDDLEMPYKRDGINGNFCNDGLLSPEKVPHPAMVELKKVYQPIYFTLVSEKPLKVKMISHYTFLSGELLGNWNVKRNDEVLLSGVISTDDLLPGEEEVITLPVDIESLSKEEEIFLNLSFTLKEDKIWAEKGFEVCSEQFVFGVPKVEKNVVNEDKVTTKKELLYYTVTGKDFEVKFDLLHATLFSFKKNNEEMLLSPIKQNFWRAPMDNDVMIVGPMRPGIANIWKDNGLDRLISKNMEEPVITEKENEVKIVFKTRFGANPYPPVLDTVETFTVYSDGTVDVNVSYEELKSPYLKDDFWWPRLGFKMELKEGLDTVSWFGKGPEENYSDRNTGSFIDWYEKKVKDMHTSYSRMQENGARTEVRKVSVSDGKGHSVTVSMLSNPFTFTSHDYTDESLTKAWHEYQLTRTKGTVLCIDVVQSGIGSSSCGPEALPEYKPVLKGKDLSFSFRMKFQ